MIRKRDVIYNVVLLLIVIAAAGWLGWTANTLFEGREVHGLELPEGHGKARCDRCP